MQFEIKNHPGELEGGSTWVGRYNGSTTLSHRSNYSWPIWTSLTVSVCVSVAAPAGQEMGQRGLSTILPSSCVHCTLVTWTWTLSMTSPYHLDLTWYHHRNCRYFLLMVISLSFMRCMRYTFLRTCVVKSLPSTQIE